MHARAITPAPGFLLRSDAKPASGTADKPSLTALHSPLARHLTNFFWCACRNVIPFAGRRSNQGTLRPPRRANCARAHSSLPRISHMESPDATPCLSMVHRYANPLAERLCPCRLGRGPRMPQQKLRLENCLFNRAPAEELAPMLDCWFSILTRLVQFSNRPQGCYIHPPTLTHGRSFQTLSVVPKTRSLLPYTRQKSVSNGGMRVIGSVASRLTVELCGAAPSFSYE